MLSRLDVEHLFIFLFLWYIHIKLHLLNILQCVHLGSQVHRLVHGGQRINFGSQFSSSTM